MAELVENRHDGFRHLTSVVYPLNGAHVMTETTVARIVLTDGKLSKVAAGVEEADGRQLSVKASGEILLCGDAYQSLQVLMLSGIGDKATLAQHSIPQQVDLPVVGQNCYDHQMVHCWRLVSP